MATLAEDVEVLKRQVTAMDRQLKVYERWFDLTAGNLVMPGIVSGNRLVVADTAMVPNLNADMVDGKHVAGYTFVPLQTKLTSTNWNLTAYSSASKTLIDLSTEFGVPAGVKAVLVRIIARDSASSSSTSGLGILLSPNNASSDGPIHLRLDSLPNDMYGETLATVSCNADGDIYYQTYASGSGTLDVYLAIWGYYI